MGLIERLRNHAQWVEPEFDRVPSEDLEQAAIALEGLRGYAVHDATCEDMTGAYPGSCTCGLSVLMKELSDD